MTKDKIAEYAYEHVPFYKDLVDKKIKIWQDYPIVDKGMLRQNIDSVFSPEYMMDLLSDRLEHVMTSGSTGECLDILWKKDQNIKSLLSLWNKRKKYYGILPKDKRCYFFTTKILGGEDLQVEETKYGLGFNKMDLSKSKVLEIYNKMVEFNPKWMIVQPSIILLFTNVLKAHSLPPLPDLKYIELTGERITGEAKSAIADFFGCKVADQYGCYEANSIAYECPYGGLHVMTENVYVETVGENEDDICITSLHNKVMPFIRYKIGDKGKIIHNHKCPCGSQEPMIKLNMARENDWIYNRDGTKCHSDLFCSVIDKINLALQQAVIQYQIIQKDYNEFDVYLVIDEEEEMDMIQQLFLENYEKYQEKSRFHFFFVNCLYPSEKTGKLAWFISNAKEKNI